MKCSPPQSNIAGSPRSPVEEWGIGLSEPEGSKSPQENLQCQLIWIYGTDKWGRYLWSWNCEERREVLLLPKIKKKKVEKKPTNSQGPTRILGLLSIGGNTKKKMVFREITKTALWCWGLKIHCFLNWNPRVQRATSIQVYAYTRTPHPPSLHQTMIANIYGLEVFAHIRWYLLYNPVRDNSVTSEQTVLQMITDSIKVRK